MNAVLPVILMVEDDSDDRLLAREAVERIGIDNPIVFVEDGIELMDYLHRQGNYENPALSPRPGLIVLDLKMPRMSGMDVLLELKADQNLSPIPVVVLTTSQDQEDRIRSMNLGASGYYTKPMRFQKLVDVMHSILTWWCDLEMTSRSTPRSMPPTPGAAGLEGGQA